MATPREEIERVARKLWGEPNRAQSSKKELRFGTNGARSLDLDKLVWFDHERQEGGGLARLCELAGEPIVPDTGPDSIAAIYPYRDERGAPLFQVVRKIPKKFVQRHADPSAPDGWAWHIRGVRRVLYRLPELLAADPKLPVFIPEGERDVDNLRALGLVATTNPGGATVENKDKAYRGKWRAEYSEHLRDRDVVILPDNDQAGRDHAADVARNLGGIARSIRIVDLPGLPEKGDVSDWFAAGGTGEALLALVAQAGVGAPEPQDDGTFPDPEWPTPLGLVAFPGIVGEFTSALMPHTEADPAALLFQFLTAFGNMIGIGPHYRVESDEHPARLFVVLVGATAKGRKGTSIGRVRALLKLVDAEWEKARVAGGLSTGEGLIFQVRDERLGNDDKGEEIVLDKGVTDKRFLAISSEFAGVLRIMARVGNSLSSIIRDAWDRSTLRTLTKAEPLAATGAHISQIGHVTADELRRYLDATETANGFANRYLFVCVKRARSLPDGGGDIDWDPIAERLKEIVATARSSYRLQMDGEARALWHSVYGELSEARPGLLGAVVARAEAQVIRLALIYALLDQNTHIAMPHLQAALECWRYAEQSARYVFGDALGDPIADSILAALRQAPDDGLTRTQISEVFGRHVESNKLARGLQALQRAGLAVPEERPTAGRPVVVWRAVRKPI